jgi:hypothetical protein
MSIPTILPARICCRVSIEYASALGCVRANGREMERTSPTKIGTLAFTTVSLQDLVARHARLNWDLVEGRPVALKYARDFLRLLELVKTDEVERIWLEHRQSQSPDCFAETAMQLRRTIVSRSDLLMPPTYSTNIYEVCPRCHGGGAFPLCDRREVLSILGYC